MKYIIDLERLEKDVELAAKKSTKRAISANCNISRATLDKIVKGGNTNLYTFLDLVNYIGANINDIIVLENELGQRISSNTNKSEVTAEMYLKSKIEDLEKLVNDKERIIKLYEKMYNIDSASEK